MRGNATTREICTLLKQANTAGDAGDHEREKQLLRRCIELDDGADVDVTGDADMPPFRLRPYLILAMALFERGEAAAALAPLHRARERWADDPDLELLLARCDEAVRAWPEAEVAYRRSIELEPRAYTCVLLGSMLDRLGRGAEAVWWLHHSLVLDPNYEESHYNVGYLLAREGDSRQRGRGFSVPSSSIPPTWTPTSRSASYCSNERSRQESQRRIPDGKPHSIISLGRLS